MLTNIFRQQFRLAATPQLFLFSSANSGAKKDGALGREKDYINKQEKDLLKNLMKKVKEQVQKVEMTPEQAKESEQKEIRDLFGKHKVSVSDRLVNDLYVWKHEK